MIQWRTTKHFWRLFSNLPLEVQNEARRGYRHFRDDPSHPGLQFKKIQGEDNIYYLLSSDWSRYRALAAMQGSRIVWYWIGSHADYDRLL